MTKEKETKEKTKKNVHKVKVRYEKDKWYKVLDDAFNTKRKDVTVAGFRKGKVPKDVYLKKFGKESLYMDAVDLLVNEAYTKALDDSKLIPIVKPKLDITSIDDNHVEFEFTFTTKPELKIKKYKGLKVGKEEVKVSQGEIDHEIGHILERYSELVVKEGKIADGDVAIIDFEGFKDGVAFEGGKSSNFELKIGSKSFIPGFEEGLIGLKKGDKKDLKLTFPEDYQAADLAGAKVVFKVEIKEVKERKERKLDKELFEDLAMEGINTKAALEKEIKKNIEARKDMEAENKYVDDLLEAVAKNVEVDIPEELVEEESQRLMGRFSEQLSLQGITLDLYYQFTNTSEEDLKANFEKEAYRNVLYRLMLEEVASLEKITTTKKEVEKQADDLAKKYNMDKEEFLNNFGGLEMIEYDLKIRRVIDLLKDLNKK